MSVSGNLKTMELAELLQWLADGCKTGTLHLDDGNVEKKIQFENGRIVSTLSTDPKEQVGHFLVSHGYISEQELATALEMQESNNLLLGEILVSIGVMTEELLERMLYLKSEETIYQLFTWTEGEFRFSDGEVPAERYHPIDITVTSIVLRGTQRLDEWRRIRSSIPSDDAVVVTVEDIASDEPGEAAILAAINDDRTISEIAVHTHSSDFHVCRFLVDLVEVGKIKLVRPRTVSGGTPTAVVEANGGGLLVEGLRLLEEGDFSGALRYLKAARSIHPESRDVREALEKSEQRIHDALAAAGIEASRVPSLTIGAEDISTLDIGSDEGFLLSRVDGSTDLKTILLISPMDPLEAQLAFMRLLTAGYVQFG